MAEEKRSSLSGLNANEAREFHGAFMTGLIELLAITII